MFSRILVAAIVVFLAPAVLASQAPPAPGAPRSSEAALRYALLVVEDARPVTRADAGPLLRALGHPSPVIVRQAVRALGRLEQAGFAPDIARVLGDRDPFVRAEAANALAQAAGADTGVVDAAAAALRMRLETERDPAVRGALCDALGRLPYATPDARVPAERVLVRELDAEFSPVALRLPAVRGLESLIRRARGSTFAAEPRTIAALRRAALGTSRARGTGDEDRARRVAVLALNAAGAVDDTYARLVIDHDSEVRRAAVAGLGVPGAPAALRQELLPPALADPSPMIRYEALRVHARHDAAAACGPQQAAAADTNAHVALLALDQLATACPGDNGATALLTTLAGTPDDPAKAPGTWHHRAHALVALARRAPDAARPHLAAAAADARWHLRMYAARAAATLGDAAVLNALAGDAQANVAQAALEGLAQVRKHDADDVFLAGLASESYPVVMAAAAALEGTPRQADAAPALLRALARITAEQRDTSRDVRLAVLTRLAAVGGAAQAGALESYLSDPDPQIAAKAADTLTTWTGTRHAASTTRVATLPLPPRAELSAAPQRLRVTMAGGRTFEIRLFTDEAPVAAWRVARLAGRGYYDGLTWHRILPNFIIQGGSPGADEFVGDGPFMRDELGRRSHDRGTVGISTRGHDTGDAQLFVNLIDNPRLDHDYTVVGAVVAGLDVVDAILEGDVMVKVEAIIP
jgi:cyclophilin family peptidyl-prolyl cis-trans isomerase/HEAT repeat protein